MSAPPHRSYFSPPTSSVPVMPNSHSAPPRFTIRIVTPITPVRSNHSPQASLRQSSAPPHRLSFSPTPPLSPRSPRSSAPTPSPILPPQPPLPASNLHSKTAASNGGYGSRISSHTQPHHDLLRHLSNLLTSLSQLLQLNPTSTSSPPSHQTPSAWAAVKASSPFILARKLSHA